MSLTKIDLEKIDALLNATLDVKLSQFEKKFEDRFQLVFDELRLLRNEIEEVKQMLTEDMNAAYEQINNLERRVAALERQLKIAQSH